MKEGYRRGIVHSNKQLTSNIYEIKLTPFYKRSGQQGLGFQGNPGQFYMIRGWDALNPFLSRPISISNIEDGEITFLYEVKGKGTHIISSLRPGDTLELLGPLGNGFDLNVKGNIAIVSGGAGLAPMAYLMRTLNCNIDFYCGFRKEVYYTDEIKNHVNSVFISTEDGSLGHKGFITEIFEPEKYDVVFTCGPLPMMEEVYEKCKDKVHIYMSLESRMACGIGACLGCSIKTKSGMKRVCKEGPVFSGEEVLFYD